MAAASGAAKSEVNVSVHDTPEAMAEAAAAEIAARLRAGAKAAIALAGGETPRLTYGRLARLAVPWDRVQVCWGDERWVGPDDPRSNYRVAREALLAHIAIPPEHIHPMPTEPDPEMAAGAYERTLREILSGEWPRFDVCVLGVGEDGHTASLFPGSPALDEAVRWVAATRAPDGSARLSLTLPAIRHAAQIVVLASGPGKAEVVRRALTGDRSLVIVRATEGTAARWFVDREAAGG